MTNDTDNRNGLGEGGQVINIFTKKPEPLPPDKEPKNNEGGVVKLTEKRSVAIEKNVDINLHVLRECALEYMKEDIRNRGAQIRNMLHQLASDMVSYLNPTIYEKQDMKVLVPSIKALEVLKDEYSHELSVLQNMLHPHTIEQFSEDEKVVQFFTRDNLLKKEEFLKQAQEIVELFEKYKRDRDHIFSRINSAISNLVKVVKEMWSNQLLDMSTEDKESKTRQILQDASTFCLTQQQLAQLILGSLKDLRISHKPNARIVFVPFLENYKEKNPPLYIAAISTLCSASSDFIHLLQGKSSRDIEEAMQLLSENGMRELESSINSNR